jgi:O-antigen/teichoic acid export membrane protein
VRQRLASLAKNLAIYGFGDVATSVASFLLLPVYVRYLTPEDYGVIGLLLSVEVVAKILFRWGVDASFMRLYYDCEDEPARQRLASTIFFFLLAVNGAGLATFLLAAPRLATWLFGTAAHTGLLRLVLVNTFIVGFYFLPFHVLRIEGRSTRFVGLTIARSVATLVLRLVLVIGLDLGVLGVVLADVIVTLAFTALLAPWFVPLLRPVVSGAVLREALRFGLPRIPHGVAHQIVAVADRYVLAHFVPLREIGLYSIGASFGLALKLFLSAFEYAWAPFYFATMRDPDARRVFSLVTTYGLAVLVLLVAGLSAVATDVVRLMTRPEFYPAARVVPWIGMGVLFQGVYLLTSIGLNITKQTALYPVATAAAAGASVAANLVLVPRFGAVGAAWSNAAAYAVLAGVAMRLSQRHYPIRYEWDRILRIGLSGAGAWLTAVILVPERLPALAGLLARGAIVLAVYPALLWVLGFYAPREMALLAALAARARRSRPPAAVQEATELAGETVSATADETEEAADGAPPGEESAAAMAGGRARRLARASGGRDRA